VGAVPSGHQPDAKALDTVKFFTSSKWQGRFADVAAQFVKHRSSIESDLQVHIGITVTVTHDLVSSLNEKVNIMMALVFKNMQTCEEKELAVIVERNGGAELVPKDGARLRKVLEQQKVPTEDDKGSTAAKRARTQASMSLTVPELEKELLKDVETILAENTKAFDQKFEIRQRQSDRVIEEVLAGMNAGPHERIKDKVRSHGF
jgi:hypothetical protein